MSVAIEKDPNFRTLLRIMERFIMRRYELVRDHGSLESHTGEYHYIDRETYQASLRHLSKGVLRFHPVRIDFLKQSSLMLITLRGAVHEDLIRKASQHIPEMLLRQGFHANAPRRVRCTHSLRGGSGGSGGGKSHNPPLLDFDLDCSFRVSGMRTPFLFVEINDSKSGRHHSRLKAHTLLLDEDGVGFRPRFALIINLMRKSEDPLAGRCRCEHPNPYECVKATVLSTRITPVPGTDRTELSIMTMAETVEVWPAVPALESAFSFTWDDMDVGAYPARLKDRDFVIDWSWIHQCIGLFERHSPNCGRNERGGEGSVGGTGGAEGN